MEGGIESLFVKVAAERCLTEEQIDALGATRQTFTIFRRAILKYEPLWWASSEDRHYVAMKALAAYVSGLLATSPGFQTWPSSNQAVDNLQSITSNRCEWEPESAKPPESGKPWVDVGIRLAESGSTQCAREPTFLARVVFGAIRRSKRRGIG